MTDDQRRYLVNALHMSRDVKGFLEFARTDPKLEKELDPVIKRSEKLYQEIKKVTDKHLD